MKKLFVGLVLAIIVIFGIWVLVLSDTIDKHDLLQSSTVLVIVVGFGLLVIFRRFISIRKGEPAEDEFSKQILQKSSSLSFYVSLYLWLIISYFNNKLMLEAEQIIGYGIIGMAIIFVGIWSFLKIKGLKND